MARMVVIVTLAVLATVLLAFSGYQRATIVGLEHDLALEHDRRTMAEQRVEDCEGALGVCQGELASWMQGAEASAYSRELELDEMRRKLGSYIHPARYQELHDRFESCVEMLNACQEGQ